MFRFVKDNIIYTKFGKLSANATKYIITTLTYMGGKVEYFLIGDLRQAVFSPEEFTTQLIKQGFKSQGLFGNIQEIVPPSRDFLATLLKKCDEQSNSRMGYKTLDTFVQGIPFFSESSGAHSAHKRKQMLSYITDPQTYMASARTIVQGQENGFLVDDGGRKVVQALLAKCIFGVDHLPTNTNEVLKEMEHHFEKGALETAYPRVVKLFKSFADKRRSAKAQADFAIFSQEFLQIQLPYILQCIHSSQPLKASGCLTADVILELMEKDGVAFDKSNIKAEAIKKYFSHPDVKSLSWIFLAAANISKAVHTGLVMARNNRLPIAYWQLAQMCFEQVINDYKKPLEYASLRSKILLMAQDFLEKFKQLPRNPFLFDHDFDLRDTILECVMAKLEQVKGDFDLYTLFTLQDLEKIYRLITHDIETKPQDLKFATRACLIDKEKALLVNNVRKIANNLLDSVGEFKLRNLQYSSELDDLYSFCLKEGVGNLSISRYVQHPVKIGNLEIPAKTYIVIDMSRVPKKANESKEREEKSAVAIKQAHQFFAAGPRLCPGMKISEFIFKSIIVEAMSIGDQNLLTAVARLTKRQANLGLISCN